MEIKYFYRLFYCENPEDPECLKRTATLVDAEPVKKEWDLQNFTNNMARENALSRPYHTYLLSALNSDYGKDKECCDDVLTIIDRLEKGKIEYYEGGGMGFMHLMTPESVTFEHIIFGICPEWPSWTCPMAHYKAALKGWRRFLDMPKSIDSELIIELPEVNEKVSAD